MRKITITAHNVAAYPEYYNLPVRLGKGELWECMGYSRTGGSVRFGRIIPGETVGEHLFDNLTVETRYLDPDKPVDVILEETNHEPILYR